MSCNLMTGKTPSGMKCSGNMAIYMVVHFILLFWGVMLALNSQPPENRVVHIVLAMLFSPLYVLSHYINQLASGKMLRMKRGRGSSRSSR